MDKLRVLAILDSLIPSNIIGIIKPMLLLQRQGKIFFSMQYMKFYKESHIENCDVVLLCRSMTLDALNVIDYAEKHNKRVIYDIDDNFFELSLDTALGKYHRHPAHLYITYEMIRNANVVRVYSKPMQSIALSLNPNTYYLKSYFDFSLLHGLERERHDKIKIVYATSRGLNDTLASIYVPAIAQILEIFSTNVEFYSFGNLPTQLIEYKNAKVLPYKANYSEYIRYFYKQGFDIGLAPLLDDVAHNSKTNNKFREYGAMNVCGIYSNTELYRECIDHEKNGLLINNTIEDWFCALKRLIEDETLRRNIIEKACQDIQTCYSMDNTLQDWIHLLSIPKAIRPTKYHNLTKLKILAVKERNDSAALNYRYFPFSIFLGFLGKHFNELTIEQISPKTLKQYDIVVYFCHNKDLIQQVFSLLGSGEIPIVIDTVLPIIPTEMKNNLFFTNFNKNENDAVRFLNYDCLKSWDLLTFGAAYSATNGQEDYMQSLLNMESCIAQRERSFYSLNSNVATWAMFLSQFPGTAQITQRPIVISIITKLFKPIKKLSYNVCSPIWRRAKRYEQRLLTIVKVIFDFIGINFLKRY